MAKDKDEKKNETLPPTPPASDPKPDAAPAAPGQGAARFLCRPGQTDKGGKPIVHMFTSALAKHEGMFECDKAGTVLPQPKK